MAEIKITKQEKLLSAATDDLYQSQFMPIFSHAETEIKKIIAKYFWENKSESILREIIDKYIDEVAKRYHKTCQIRKVMLVG